MPKDPYEILGVSKNASDADIKQAYRKLSKEWHPDKHPSTRSTGSGQVGSGQAKREAEEKYKEINQAYELLSDPKRRQMYDQFGHAGGRAGSGFGFGGVDPSEFMSAFGGFEDILETFFGSGFGVFAGGGVRRSRVQEQGRDMEVAVRVPFESVVSGGTQEVTMRKHALCSDCGGMGSREREELKDCSKCDGKGVTVKIHRSFLGVIERQSACEHCGGSGRVMENPCRSCGGEGRREEKTTITVRIPPGVDSGTTLRLSGEGEAGRRGAKAGDLYVHVDVEGDPRFEREGSDIRSRVRVRVEDAVLGAEIPIETVHGEVIVKIPEGTQPGQVIRLKGKGLPVLSSSRHGDHYVEVLVEIPKRLSRSERKLWEELRSEA
jgi:molecular chaperone DnaJ